MARERIPIGDERLLQVLHTSDLTREWPVHPGKWVVYTIYEAHRRIKVPLYIGVTGNLRDRLKQHRRGSAWWPLGGAIKVHGFFDTRADGYEAEEQQIWALQPLLNSVVNDHSGHAEVDR